MKTKFWAVLVAVIFLLCCGASAYLLRSNSNARYARIISCGKVLRVVDLGIDQTFQVETGSGSNTITIRSGKIAVTDSTCPDHYCQARGYCSGGADIICLPNQLVIQFLSDDGPDAVVG